MKNNLINIAKKSALAQINELKKIKSVFNKSFIKSIEHISNCKGKVITAGIGKSGIIARKFQLLYHQSGYHLFFSVQTLITVTLARSKKRIFY